MYYHFYSASRIPNFCSYSFPFTFPLLNSYLIHCLLPLYLAVWIGKVCGFLLTLGKDIRFKTSLGPAVKVGQLKGLVSLYTKKKREAA